MKKRKSIVNKAKIFVRILELIIIIGTVKLMPIAIEYAAQIRGYKAYGGEYLLPLLSLLLIMLIETMYETIKALRRGENDARR